MSAAPGTVRLVLELDLTTDGPSGRLLGEGGSASKFAGWLQLMDGLDEARRRATPAEHAWKVKKKKKGRNR